LNEAALTRQKFDAVAGFASAAAKDSSGLLEPYPVKIFMKLLILQIGLIMSRSTCELHWGQKIFLLVQEEIDLFPLSLYLK